MFGWFRDFLYKRKNRREEQRKRRIERGSYWRICWAHEIDPSGGPCSGKFCGYIQYDKEPWRYRFCPKCGTARGNWRIGRQRWSRYLCAKGWLRIECVGDFEDMSGGWK